MLAANEPPLLVDPATLFREVMRARTRVYRAAGSTPLEAVPLPDGGSFLLKREDLSPIHSYKWRGAFNKLAVLAEAGQNAPVVTASAGNHAQGVALAASKLHQQATIFMPAPTPALKIKAVRQLAGCEVEVVLTGDTFDEAAQAAADFAHQHAALLIHPFDDLHVIAGQGTIGDEIVNAGVRPDVVYLQIGGGGLAAGVACVLKTLYPEVRIIGVEGEGQASMCAAMQAGKLVPLAQVDRFCDGTAVRQVGQLTFPLCRQLIDEFRTVSNEAVCAAMQYLWEARRIIPEPSGALGVAALLAEASAKRQGGMLAVMTGANMDFVTLTRLPIRAKAHAGTLSTSFVRKN
jgi:threonine dehydratase